MFVSIPKLSYLGSQNNIKIGSVYFHANAQKTFEVMKNS